VVYCKLLSKLFHICLPLKKFVNRKHFSVKVKFSLIFRKEFFFYFWSCCYYLIISNLLLFINYIKFDHQFFYCYIFYLESFFIYFFNFIPYNLIFISTLIHIFFIVFYFSLIFLIKIFYLSDLSIFFWLLFILFEIIYEIGSSFTISSTFNFCIGQIWSLFFYYLFYSKEFIKLSFFFQFHHPSNF
jgi:hypothetical protein